MEFEIGRKVFVLGLWIVCGFSCFFAKNDSPIVAALIITVLYGLYCLI